MGEAGLEEEAVNDRVVGLALLLGSPGLMVGVAATVLLFVPTTGMPFALVGFGSLGLAGIGSAIGAYFLTRQIGGTATFCIFAFLGGVTAASVTASLLMHAVLY
jgi:hypothetical protein